MSNIAKQSITQPDPNEKQQRASDPLSSVWVGASAGTGKTKVLVDRLLRLLLPRQLETGDIKDGTPPTKILCLTFTKAAASEMANRVNELLSKWTIMNDDDLTKALFDLTGQTPNNVMRDAARRLFAQVIDAPGGMKIMTLHSFCQSILSRFPLEAGLMPGFKIGDERQANELMNQAIQNLIVHPTPATEPALDYFITQLDGERFKDVLKEIMRKRKRINYLLDHYGGLEKLIAYLYGQHGLSPETTPETLVRDYQPDEQALRQAIGIMAEDKTATNIKNANLIASWLNCDAQNRINSFADYASAFLVKAGTIKANKTLVTDKLGQSHPDILPVLQKEAENVFTIIETISLLKILRDTGMMLTLSTAIIEQYNGLKKQHALLDYDDQINMTVKLLSGHQTPQWVLFKLDNGIDHILVDEAQDTSPQQWQIVKKLAEEFFHGIGTRQDDVTRTIFAVGDEKQSIYSFQDADPKLFLEMADYFKTLVEQAEQDWQQVDMDINFRSSPAVLDGVDRVFDNEAMRLSVSLKPNTIQHIPYHSDRPGLIEIWPPYELQASQIGDLFHLPTTRIPQSNPMILLCQNIATTIETWLKEKRTLTSYGRPVQAGDIMILLQSRRPMMDALIKACKDRNIPVTGTDRMTLTDQLVVKDVLSAIDFCLLPTDDLTLANLLKSPLIGMSEDNLFSLAHDREKQSLWHALQNKQKQWPEIHTYLNDILSLSETAKPFEFISYLLVQPCPNNSKSGRRSFFSRLGMEVKDPLDELLNAAQNFETKNPPGLQGFVHWLTATDMEIKRELSSSDNQVRIMTVHGSKGLQAPIVFIPDAFKTPTEGNKNLSFYWPQNIDEPFLWASGQNNKNNAIEKIKQANKLNRYDEYCRLLYVAMTRAEDELYVAGWTKTKTVAEHSWYAHIKNAWQDKAQEIFVKNYEQPVLRLEFKGTSTPSKKTIQDIVAPIDRSQHPWIDRVAPIDPQRPTPLTPSRPVVTSSPVQSPLERDTMGPFWRGSLIHKILQTLPNVAQDQQSKTLTHYLSQPHLKLSPSAQEQLTNEVMTVLTHQDYAKLFSNHSQAEVPIVGEIILEEKSVAISGQIDRLLVEENDVWIVDYKTNRPPPSDIKNVPEDYLYQMATYHALMKNLYPDHTIHCVLLWTHTPLWMDLSIAMIEEVLKNKASNRP